MGEFDWPPKVQERALLRIKALVKELRIRENGEEMKVEHQLRLMAEHRSGEFPPYDFTFRGETLGEALLELRVFLRPGGFLESTFNRRLTYRTVICTEWELAESLAPELT